MSIEQAVFLLERGHTNTHTHTHTKIQAQLLVPDATHGSASTAAPAGLAINVTLRYTGGPVGHLRALTTDQCGGGGRSSAINHAFRGAFLAPVTANKAFAARCDRGARGKERGGRQLAYLSNQRVCRQGARRVLRSTTSVRVVSKSRHPPTRPCCCISSNSTTAVFLVVSVTSRPCRARGLRRTIHRHTDERAALHRSRRPADR